MYRKAHEDLVQFYKRERGLLDCTDIGDLKQTLHINHNPLDWQLFTDSPNLCLKAVLFHNGNTLPYNSVGHSAHNKSHMRTWRLYWKPLTRWIQMENLRRLSYYLDYNKDSQNIAASFVNGTAELGLFISQESFGLPENRWNQDSWMWKFNHLWNREKFCCHPFIKAWCDE